MTYKYEIWQLASIDITSSGKKLNTIHFSLNPKALKAKAKAKSLKEGQNLYKRGKILY